MSNLNNSDFNSELKEKTLKYVNRCIDMAELGVDSATKFNQQATRGNGEVAQYSDGEVATASGHIKFRSSKDKEARERFFDYVINGINHRELFYHNIGDVSQGGAYATPDFSSEVSMGLPNFSQLLSLITTSPTNSNEYIIPRISGATSILPTDYVTSWKGEGGGLGDSGTSPVAQQTPHTQLFRLTCKLLAPDPVVISREASQDIPQFEAALARVFSAHFALALEQSVLVGDSITMPRGILSYLNAGISSVTIGAGTGVTYDGLLDLYAALPSSYAEQAVFIMNRQTFIKFLKLKGTSNDAPTFDPLGYGWTQRRFLERPVILSEYMPNAAAGVGSVIFCNPKYYRVAQRMGSLEVLRDTSRWIPNIGLYPFWRVAGDVEEPMAFRIGVTS